MSGRVGNHAYCVAEIRARNHNIFTSQCNTLNTVLSARIEDAQHVAYASIIILYVAHLRFAVVHFSSTSLSFGCGCGSAKLRKANCMYA